jgi:peptidoglycan/xylan/chitin deacetylase (PgdA/CDA1 family)
MSGRIYLSFDDGPDPLWTPLVLEALERAHARATFFVNAPRAKTAADLVARALRRGHGVELHCNRHELHSLMTPAEVEADTRDGLAILAQIGVRPQRWRPPGGVRMPWTVAAAARHGLTLTGWSADPRDWCGGSPAEMLERLAGWLRPGSVVVMHDALGPGARRADCAGTVGLIEPLVATIRSMGAEPAPLPAPLASESAGVSELLHGPPAIR